MSEYVKEIKTKNITIPNKVEEKSVEIEFNRVTDNELKLIVI